MTIQRSLFCLAVPVIIAWLATPFGVAQAWSGPAEAFLVKGEDDNAFFYRNSYFGFGMMLPRDWEIVLTEELRRLMEEETGGKIPTGPGEFLLLRVSQFYETEETEEGVVGRNFVLGALDVSPFAEIETGRDYIELLMKGAEEGEVVKVGLAPHTVKLDGGEFWKFSGTKPGTEAIHMTWIATVRKGYGLSFLLMGYAQSDISELETILRTLIFDDDGKTEEKHDLENIDPVAMIMERGRYYAKRKEYDSAIRDYDKVLEDDPLRFKAYLYRGSAYCEIDDYGQALRDFNKAIEIEPQSAIAYSKRARVYENRGDFDQVIRDCNKAIDLNPVYASAYNRRGAAYNNMNDYNRAIFDLNIALDINPDFELAYLNRAKAYSNQGDQHRAINDLNRYLKLRPDDAGAYASRGLAYARKGRLVEADRDFDRALELKDNDPVIHFARGEAYRVHGELEQAAQEFMKAVALDATFTRAYINLGTIYFDSGHYDRALQAYTKAIEGGSKLAVPVFGRGLSLQAMGEREPAAQEYTKACKMGYGPACTELEKLNNRGIKDTVSNRLSTEFIRKAGGMLLIIAALLLGLYCLFLRRRRSGQ